MSSSSSEETEMVVRSKEPSWNSIESVFNQKLSKLTTNDSWLNFSSRFNPNFTVSDLESRRIQLKNMREKWELVGDRTWFPRIKPTRSLLKDELEMLKINMSVNDNMIPLKHPQLMKRLKLEAKYGKKKKQKYLKKTKVSDINDEGEVHRSKDLIYEIEKSETAKRDKTAWKFLKRGSSVKKEFITSTKLALEIQILQTSDTDLHNSRYENIKPVNITCPNCLFYITTTVKNIKSIRFKIISIMSATIGCVFPNVFYTFRDTVHLCPLCKIYLGFCPAFHIRTKKNRSSARLVLSKYMKKRGNNLKEKRIRKRKIKPIKDVKMVSASSTSAKNLFVESKLRLSDRVQVNVNNIAAITRQIQRGSKSTENLMTAAKNFAIQEAAIENSETNLKKLKLLTTHINNQLDSLHNSSMKMEEVLEQVRSMQR